MAGTAKRMKLVPEDDYMHPVESASNFNESMYFNVFGDDLLPLPAGWPRRLHV